MSIGKIVQISGPIIDCKFNAGELPKIKEALSVTVKGKKTYHGSRAAYRKRQGTLHSAGHQ